MALTKISTDGVKDDAITKTKIPANQIEASELADNAVDTNAIANNAVTAGKLASGVTDLSNDTSPQLGGDLASNSNDILMADTDKIKCGNGPDFELFHNGSSNNTEINQINNSGHMQIASNRLKLTNYDGPETYIDCISNGAVELYHDNIKKLQTNGTYGTILGNTTDDANFTNALLLTRRGYETSGYGVALQPKGGSAASQNGLRIAISDASSYNSKFTFDNDGLKFGSDTAAANALDGYEEGEWTPVVSDSGASTVYTYNTHYEFRSNSGTTSEKVSYVKIGSMVYLNFSIYFNASIDKRFRISLPFSYTGSDYQIGFTPVMYSITMGGDTLGTLGAQGSKFDVFRITNATTTVAGHATVPVTANTEMYFNFHYEAS